MSAEELLEEAGRRLGASLGVDLEPSSEGVLSLLLTPGVVCHVEAPEGADHVFFHAPLLDRASEVPDLLRRVLALNMFALELPGAWLALDEEADKLVLCFALAAALFQPEEFGAYLTSVLDEHDRLGHVLGGRPADAAESGEFRGEAVILRA